MKPTSPASISAKTDLATVVTDVLGDLAFMVTDGHAPALPPGLAWLQGEIAYRGPVGGTVRCWCTREFATRLAANLLGTEPGDGDAHEAAEDAVREFLNVVCGHLVTSWYGSAPVFTLSIPLVCECAEVPAAFRGRADAWCEYTVDDQPLVFGHQWDHAAGGQRAGL